MTSMIRTRWAALGAAVAVTLGGGGIGLVSATTPSSATAFVPITACRVMDTRPAPDTVGPRSAPLGAGDTHTVTVHGANGNCTGIPATATAVQLNVTAVGASTLTFLTLWATGDAQPDASSLNPSPGQPPTPNAVTTGLNASGQFNIFNKFGSVNVLADITGYYVDHHHDDRYYTKAQVNDLVNPNVAYYQPALFDFVAQDPDWSIAGGWFYGGTTQSCLYADVPAAAGTTIDNVVVNYTADAPLIADQVGVLSLRTTPGATGTDRALVHHNNDDVPFPASAAAVGSLTVVNDPAEAPAGFTPGPIGDDTYDALIGICVRDPITIVSVRVNFG